MDRVVIRAARRDDVAEMARLLVESAESQGARESLCVDAGDLLRDGFGASPRFQALVAGVESRIVAIALYYFNFSTWVSTNGLHLEDLYVEAGWRRRGIARALMRELIDIAIEHQCRRFQWFVLRSNDDARRFYESMGARVLDDWVFMQLDVTSLSGRAST